MNNLCDWYVVSKYCKNERKVFGPPYGDASVDNTQMEDTVPAPPLLPSTPTIRLCRCPCRRLFGGHRWRCSKILELTSAEVWSPAPNCFLIFVLHVRSFLCKPSEH
jgi:hypothetical protein